MLGERYPGEIKYGMNNGATKGKPKTTKDAVSCGPKYELLQIIKEREKEAQEGEYRG